MLITVNGKTMEMDGPLTLAQLIGHLGVDSSRTVAELNGVVVMREKFPSEIISDGDRVELVRFVGGG